MVLGGAEWLVIAAWAAIVAPAYLNLDQGVVPGGREYLSNIQTHFLWTRAAECGWCALWNGHVRGGYPALADPHGSMVHPLVMLTTLIWGVLNGSKLALLGSLFLAGVAQWWLARVLGLGRVAGLWSACLAVGAGHLSGKMEAGNFGLLLSTAACSLALPPLMALFLDGSRRMAVLLGITLAMAVVAGQAYMQVGLALSLPLAAVLLPWRREALLTVARRFALACGIALLLAAPLLVPLLHFLPQFGKDVDPGFESGQPLAFVPLNLVISDPEFYLHESLGKLPFPYLYMNFVGWLPVLLALWALQGLWRSPSARERRIIAFLAGLAFLVMWLASTTPMAWLTRTVPLPWLTRQLAGLRYLPVVAGLAVPAIVALAAMGADRLLRVRLHAPAFTPSQVTRGAAAPHPGSLAARARPGRGPRGSIRAGAPGIPAALRALVPRLRWLLLVPLALTLRDARAFSQHWMITTTPGPSVAETLQALRTPDLQWVNPPFGEQFWIEPALRLGLKLSLGTQGWYWAGRTPPGAVLEGHRKPDTVAPGMTLYAIVGEVPIYAAPPGQEYAAVDHPDGERTICTAHGTGGDIDVTCNTDRPGTLTVKENYWSGWRAWLDGRPVPLLPGPWLAVELPGGARPAGGQPGTSQPGGGQTGGGHTITLRYRPWDVPLSLFLCAAGLVLAAFSWWRPERQSPPGGALPRPGGAVGQHGHAGGQP
ncbi:MAG TPA: hypothetical protein VHS99_05825 [Chloroflexota bacterium]|nr:hypothetical protein [Chloroflexota bacterium]